GGYRCAAGKPADQGAGKCHQPPGQSAFAHDVSGKYEQRQSQIGEVVDTGEHPLYEYLKRHTAHEQHRYGHNADDIPDRHPQKKQSKEYDQYSEYHHIAPPPSSSVGELVIPVRMK